MQNEKDSNVITLRGSTDIVAEFFMYSKYGVFDSFAVVSSFLCFK